jgi:phosphoesterase RecJ-like protein
MTLSTPIDKATIEAIQTEFNQAKKILLTTHKSPDGDAIGSSLALYLHLKSLGYNVVVSIPDPAPEFLHWLPSFKDIITYKKNKQALISIIEECDLILTIDYNHFARTGSEMAKNLEASKATKILIDHHQEPDNFMKYKVWDVNASSSSQLVYDLIVGLSGKDAITKEIGECIYTGLMTDTGSFRFATCTSHTMRIAAHLLDCGVDGNKIHQLVYDQNSIDRLHLMGYALEKMVLLEDYFTAYISLSKEELDRFNYKSGDTEGLVNKVLSVKGVKVAALLSEKEGNIRISFRSSAQFSVNEFSRKHFNGGGHYHAAGGNLTHDNITQACELFESTIKKYKNELESA